MPGSLDRAVLTSWLKANTDLDPGSVISVSPANIIGVMAVNRVDTPSKRVFRAQIRSEVISAQTIREAGNSSWAADVEVDCQTRRGKVNRILDFPQRNLKGPAREAGGSAEWVAPPAGTHLYTVVAAVCDDGFERPLAPNQQTASLASGAMAAAAPQPAPRAPASAVIATAPSAAAPGTPASPAGSAGTPAVSRAPAQTASLASAPAQRTAVKPTRRSSVAVQIAAADTEAQAAKALRSAMNAFADRLEGASMSTVQAEVSGRTVYRALLHGFATAGDAQSFCDAYKAAGRDCFVRGSLPANAHTIVSR